MFMLGLGMSVSTGEEDDFVKGRGNAWNKLVHVSEGESVCSEQPRSKTAVTERGETR